MTSQPQYDRFLQAGSRQEFLEFAAQFDAPAFVRRAENTEAATEAVYLACAAARQRMLSLCHTRLAMLAALVELDWNRLGEAGVATLPVSGSDTWDAAYLAELHRDWQPQLRVRVEPARGQRPLRKALGELANAFDFFNRKWSRFLDAYDLSDVNRVRQAYNDYYVLEKACAFGSEQLAQAGFRPLEMLTAQHLRERFPLLLRGHGDRTRYDRMPD